LWRFDSRTLAHDAAGYQPVDTDGLAIPAAALNPAYTSGVFDLKSKF
jgi:hypothetical protein